MLDWVDLFEGGDVDLREEVRHFPEGSLHVGRAVQAIDAGVDAVQSAQAGQKQNFVASR